MCNVDVINEVNCKLYKSILIWSVQGLYTGHQIQNLEPSPLYHEGNWETKSFVNYMLSNLQDYPI